MPEFSRTIMGIRTGLSEELLITITALLAIAITLTVAAIVRWVIHSTREASLFQSTHEQQNAADDESLAVIRLRDEAFQNLMARLSAQLVAANRHNLSEVLSTCISLIGDWSAADRCGQWVNARKSRTPKLIFEYVRSGVSASPVDELTDVNESTPRSTYWQFQSRDEEQFVLSCDDSVRLSDKLLTIRRDCFARGIHTIIYRDLWPRRESLGQLYLQYESRDQLATAPTSAQLTVLANMIGGAIERTFAEQRLLESEQQFRSLSVAAPVGIVLLSRTGKCEFLNVAARNLLRFEQLHPQDLDWSQLLLPDRVSTFQTWLNESLLDEMSGACEATMRVNQSFRYLQVDMMPRYNAEGVCSGFVLTILDITARRRAEQSVQETQQKLADSQRLSVLGVMTAAISHEINQPLLAVSANARSLQRCLDRDALSEQQLLETLQDIVSDNDRAATVIRKINQLVRNDPPHYELIMVDTLFKDVIQLTAAAAERKDVLVTTHNDPADLKVLVDRIQFQQLLCNLVTNSLDAIDRRPEVSDKIELSAFKEGDSRISLTVTDTGTGLDNQRPEDLFEPFHTTKEHGTGIGLAICQHIVKAHDGTICADENQMGGLTVRVTIPEQPDDQVTDYREKKAAK